MNRFRDTILKRFRKHNTKSKASSAHFEVCQGSDCSGSGGGAAVLEIEELVQEYSTREDACIRVVRGGCRNLCSIGPNVHYPGGQHFSKIASVDKCLEVDLESINSERKEEQETSALPISTKLLVRQANRLRWRAL